MQLTQSAWKGAWGSHDWFYFSDWMKKWHEFLMAIVQRSECKTNYLLTLDWKPLYKYVYNIVSRAAQSNSVYVSVLKISIVQADCASKSLRQKFRTAIVGAGKILYFATIRDTNRDSAHHSQNEDNFPTFSLGQQFLNQTGKEKNNNNNGKGDSASAPLRFASLYEGEMQQILTERHSGKTKQMTNWSVSTFKGELKFFRFKIVKYKTRVFKKKLK